jgi:hypothetical protein
VRPDKLRKPRHQARVFVYRFHAAQILVAVNDLETAQFGPGTVLVPDIDRDGFPYKHLHRKVVHGIEIVQPGQRPALLDQIDLVKAVREDILDTVRLYVLARNFVRFFLVEDRSVQR